MVERDFLHDFFYIEWFDISETKKKTHVQLPHDSGRLSSLICNSRRGVFMEIIRLENVTKSYGDKLVLDHIDKVFHRGEARPS